MGPMPVPLRRKSLGVLQKDLYMAAPKTDGQRAMVLFAMLPHPSIFIFGRDCDFVQVSGKAPPTFFRQTGTLIDAELTEDGILLAFDVVFSTGVSMTERNYLNRLDELKSVVENPEFSILGLEILVKRAYPLYDFQQMLRDLESSAFKNDGVIFTPVNGKIRRGTAGLTFKYKHNQTVDLAFEGDELRWQTERGPRPVMSVGDHGLSLISSALPDKVDRDGVHEFAVTMNRKEDTFVLRWIKDRRDERQVPNFHTTVRETFLSVEENLTLEEIARVTCSPQNEKPVRQHSPEKPAQAVPEPRKVAPVLREFRPANPKSVIPCQVPASGEVHPPTLNSVETLTRALGPEKKKRKVSFRENKVEI